ncbi:MAG: hypothetical protein MSH50_02490 [Firmicutes bacterium]|nr:hypothetical protein [Bacillota bacterium]
MSKKPKEMYKISVNDLNTKQSQRLMDMYLYEIGYGVLPDDAVIAAVQKSDMKKIKTFVELLGGNVEIIDTWLVENYY